MKFGVTEDGFVRKTYNDILGDLQARAREAYGESINLTNSSLLGMHLQNEAWEMASMWEIAEDIYYSSFVDYSEGSSLDNVGKYITASRKPAQKSKGLITIEGREDTRIRQGFRVATKDLEKVFETTESATIGESGIIDVAIKSLIPGLEMNVAPYSIIEIVNPISGVEKVYNKDITTDGLNIEPDFEFRERYYRSVSLGGNSTREAVEASILDMEEVADAFVDENDTMEYIVDIPPKSLAPYVFGGEDEDIAKVILKSKAGGIRSYGETELEVEDSKGVSHIIGFTRPDVVNIYVRVRLSRDVDYPGDEVVTRAILNYIGGEDKDGIRYKGLKLGQDVVISKILASAMCIGGTKDIEVEISTDNITFVSTNIEIAKKEIARTKYDKVVISHV